MLRPWEAAWIPARVLVESSPCPVPASLRFPTPAGLRLTISAGRWGWASPGCGGRGGRFIGGRVCLCRSRGSSGMPTLCTAAVNFARGAQGVLVTGYGNS